MNLPLVAGLGMCGPCVTGEADTMLDGADLLSEEDAEFLTGAGDTRPRCSREGCKNTARAGRDYCGRHAPTPKELRQRTENRRCSAPGCSNMRRRGYARCRPCDAKFKAARAAKGNTNAVI